MKPCEYPYGLVPCPADATRGNFCPVHAERIFELAEVSPEETAKAVANRNRIARLYGGRREIQLENETL